jgi:UPF0716 protein FxsA
MHFGFLPLLKVPPMSSFQLLLLVFLAVPALEVYLFVQVGGIIGGLWTGLAVIGTAVLGAWLLRLQGISTLQRMQGALGRGELPAVELVEGLVLLVAGALLLTPGFFTDAVGFLALIPGIRRWLALRLLDRFVVSGRVGPVAGGEQGRPRAGRVLDGEYTRR